MTVISAYETFNRRGVTENETVQTEYERSFDVLTDTIADTPDTILAATDPITGLETRSTAPCGCPVH